MKVCVVCGDDTPCVIVDKNDAISAEEMEELASDRANEWADENIPEFTAVCVLPWCFQTMHHHASPQFSTLTCLNLYGILALQL